jgi:hypothetical protein
MKTAYSLERETRNGEDSYNVGSIISPQTSSGANILTPSTSPKKNNKTQKRYHDVKKMFGQLKHQYLKKSDFKDKYLNSDDYKSRQDEEEAEVTE